MDEEPGVIFLPFAKVIIDRLAGRIVMGQHAPLAAGIHHVHNGIDDGPDIPFQSPSAARLKWEDTARVVSIGSPLNLLDIMSSHVLLEFLEKHAMQGHQQSRIHYFSNRF
jgi:hypothetical protein